MKSEPNARGDDSTTRRILYHAADAPNVREAFKNAQWEAKTNKNSQLRRNS